MLGRLIGLAFALPLAWFWLRRAIPAGYKARLIALLALGGLQGVFGWYMVQSGLVGASDRRQPFLAVDPPDHRAVHARRACLDGARPVALARDLAARPARLTSFAAVAGLMLLVQLVLGAWVAGLNAGLASDTWPLMQGRLVPEYDGARGFLWAAAQRPFLVHFLHRWWAWVVVAALVVLGAQGAAHRAARVDRDSLPRSGRRSCSASPR